MYRQFQSIKLFKADKFKPTTCLKSPTIRRLRNAGLDIKSNYGYNYKL